MIGHETEGVADPLMFLDFGEDGEKTPSFGVIKEDICPCISPGGNMIDGSGIFDS